MRIWLTEKDESVCESCWWSQDEMLMSSLLHFAKADIFKGKGKEKYLAQQTGI